MYSLRQRSLFAEVKSNEHCSFEILDYHLGSVWLLNMRRAMGLFDLGDNSINLCNIIGIFRLEIEKLERRLIKGHSLCWMPVFSDSMSIHKFEIGENCVPVH